MLILKPLIFISFILPIVSLNTGTKPDINIINAQDSDINRSLIFLTLSPNASNVNINFAIHNANVNGQYNVTVNTEPDKAVILPAVFNYTISDAKLISLQNSDDLAVRSAIIQAPKTQNDLDYTISHVTHGKNHMTRIDDDNSPTNLRVCVFGDYRADLYADIALNLSRYIDENECNLNLFIGKIVWEHRSDGFAFNPHVMLHNDNTEGRHLAFSRVPSIFGGIGSKLTETTFFDSTEVNGVAFIQTTVTLVTLANITYGTEQFNKVEEYFRETMLNELECKLQELYKRQKKPWIIVYLTHPSLYKELSVNWLLLNSVDRFFEILKRYKIDLLTSCGIEGMSKILEERHQSHPDEQLPTYIQTTLAECGGYMAFAPTVQNECSYTVLDIQKELLVYRKKGFESNLLINGTINKNTQKPDKCVEHEL